MFRAMSTRKVHGGYEKLVEDEPKLKRVTSVPASVYGNSRNPVQEEVKKTPTVKPTGGSVHPLLSFFDVRFQKKKKKTKKSLATAKPEFARYMAYVKEGGVWDPNSNAPRSERYLVYNRFGGEIGGLSGRLKSAERSPSTERPRENGDDVNDYENGEIVVN
ncbi:unnamed protein product [Brassica rapa]|uniref:Uncharacterized protein n=2 Tax=Brassica TaxID=3705 RepID=M4F6Z1_BRACM|nr:unnamed protein product [Brassica napus]CAG7865147.1 unnamed protein product [Brassica rapa]